MYVSFVFKFSALHNFVHCFFFSLTFFQMIYARNYIIDIVFLVFITCFSTFNRIRFFLSTEFYVRIPMCLYLAEVRIWSKCKMLYRFVSLLNTVFWLSVFCLFVGVVSLKCLNMIVNNHLECVSVYVSISSQHQTFARIWERAWFQLVIVLLRVFTMMKYGTQANVIKWFHEIEYTLIDRTIIQNRKYLFIRTCVINHYQKCNKLILMKKIKIKTIFKLILFESDTRISVSIDIH